MAGPCWTARRSCRRTWCGLALPGCKGVPHPGRWGVLLGLVVLPEDTCRFFARREVARVNVGNAEEGEVRVRERAAELLQCVPWRGTCGSGSTRNWVLRRGRGWSRSCCKFRASSLASAFPMGGARTGEVLQRLQLEQVPRPPAWMTGGGGLGEGLEVLPGWRLEPVSIEWAAGLGATEHGELGEEGEV